LQSLQPHHSSTKHSKQRPHKTLPLQSHHLIWTSLAKSVPSQALLFIQEVFFVPIIFGLCISKSSQPLADHQYLVQLSLTESPLRSLVINSSLISDHLLVFLLELIALLGLMAF
jgi:hypothetical protein